MAGQNSGTSEDTKTIVTVLALIFAYPIGLILMWVWTHWKTWLKILLTAPVIVVLLALLSTGFLVFSGLKQNAKESVNTVNIQTASPTLSPKAPKY